MTSMGKLIEQEQPVPNVIGISKVSPPAARTSSTRSARLFVAISGLAHLTMNDGVLLKVYQNDTGRYMAVPWKRLPAAPVSSSPVQGGGAQAQNTEFGLVGWCARGLRSGARRGGSEVRERPIALAARWWPADGWLSVPASPILRAAR
jgi:hypothetical protein